MTDDLQPAFPDLLARIRARTPARLLVDRAGAAYRTETQLELREAHAAARDAVRTELDLLANLGAEFVREQKLFEVATCATSKDEYLLRPDLGRSFSEESRKRIRASCPLKADLQIVIGDGLSVTAVATQVPRLLPLIIAQAKNIGSQGRSPDHQISGSPDLVLGQPFVIRHCRVGIMNEIGGLLAPQVVVLLIGERPGLATAESLSAYMAFRPKSGDNDARRNLISNIHARGVSVQSAAERIVKLAVQMMARQASGTVLKEELPNPIWLEGK